MNPGTLHRQAHEPLKGRSRFGEASESRELLERVLVSCGITCVCCAMTLALVDKLPLLDQPDVAVERMLLVAFPAQRSWIP